MSPHRDASPHVPRPGHLKEISEDDCFELLQTTTVGRVAFTNEEGQQLIPVNFRVLDNTIYFRTAVGTALAELADGSDDVAFEVDFHDQLYGTGWNVTVRGTTTAAGAGSVVEVMSAPRALTPWAPGERGVVVQLVPQTIAGRRVRRG